MIKLKKVRLVNFGGYEDSTFDFTNGLQLDGYVPPSLRESTNEIMPISLFFGPNGIGKSTILEAVRFVANPKVFYGRQQGPDVYLRPWVRDTEYQPISDHVLKKPKSKMRVEATFSDGEKDYNVWLTNLGFEKNELPDRPEGSASGGYLYYVDADNPINWSKFQLNNIYAQRFIDLAEAIYGYSCDLDGEVVDHHFDENTGEVLETQTYYQDLIITKGTSKIHFSRMSAGEKKIATMIRQLCNPDATDDRDIILIDNWEMHVYFKRHPKMIEKLKEYFSGKQIIATTHSQSMIEYGEKAPYVKLFDLEDFKPEYKMFDAPAFLKNIPEPKQEETKMSQISISDDSLLILKEKLASAPLVTDPNALPDGFVRKTIMTPHGEMNVIVPAGNDKASGDALQSMMDNAVKIDIDESGNVEAYSDPNANKFRPGTGQIKRAKPQLTPGQRKRLEGGEAIITDPVNLAPSESTIADFEQARTQAVVSTIAANAESAEKIEESQKQYSVSSIAELGRGACCTGGFCGTVVAAPIANTVLSDPTPVVSATPWVVSRGDGPLSPVEAAAPEKEEKPASFWEKVIGLFK